MSKPIPEIIKWAPWQMLSYTHFTKDINGYVIDVESGNPCRWSICKDGIIVDSCYYHNPAYGEAAGKVQSEKALQKIIQNL